MYSLFSNIFLSFWAAIIIVGLAIAWYTEKLSEDEVPPLFKKQHHIFKQQSEEAQHTLEQSGINGFFKWTTNTNNVSAINDIFIVDKNGMELSHQLLPPDVESFIRSGFNLHFNIPFNATQDSILGYRAVTPDGQPYHLVTTFNKPHPLFYLLTPHRIVIGIIVSGLICFALARHLVSPIKKLRQAALQLSQGNLDTRIDLSVHQRIDEIGDLAKDLDFMAQRLKAMMDSQKQLMRDISHELRSPMARMQVALELARKQKISNIEPELQRIELEIDRLDALIDELLSLVRMEANRESSKASRIIINDLLGNIVSDSNFEYCHPQQNHFISIDCPSDLELNGNLNLLYSSLENVIRNACFFSPVHSKVKVKCRRSKKHLTITVQDEGPGVPEDMLQKIFDPFARVSKSRESQSGGYGIGLAISKRAIELHNGQITATNNTSGSGLIITITLPVVQPQSVGNYQQTA